MSLLVLCDMIPPILSFSLPVLVILSTYLCNLQGLGTMCSFHVYHTFCQFLYWRLHLAGSHHVSSDHQHILQCRSTVHSNYYLLLLQIFLLLAGSRHFQGGASWWTAEEENDRISMKKTNYIKSTMLSFLKVCLYSYYTKCQFYQISLFCQLKIVFHKINENHFFKDCILNFT